MSRVHIDIESYSELDLTKVGLYRYATHPSTCIQLVSWAVDDGPVQQVDCVGHDGIPVKLLRDIHPVVGELPELHAFNAPFERIMFEKVWAIKTPLDQWHCTMIHAWSLGYSGGLGDVGKQMGMEPDKVKLAEGKKLVLKFCKPAPKNRKVDVYNRDNSPEDWAKYKVYNQQDVIAERAMKALLDPYPIPYAERQAYLLDQKINGHGLPIDTTLVDNAVRINAEEKALVKLQMNELTGLVNANSAQQLQPWLLLHGLEMPNMQKATVEAALKLELPPLVREVLLLRAQANQTSTAKYAVVQMATFNDHLHGVFQFAGAQRTQRWAGRLFQPHNLKRGYPDADQRAELLLHNSRAAIKMIEGNVMTYLSNIMRTVVTAPDGLTLAVSDFGSIESRVLGWQAGCSRINNLFAAGMDSYKDFATEVYHCDYDQVTKSQRGFCKPPVLGCGYQLGGKGLVTYADGMGVSMHETEAQRLVDLWRNLYSEVVDMWYWLKDACIYVTENWEAVSGYAVTIRRDNDFLFIDLPSGRSIAYHRPTVEMRTPPGWSRRVRTLTYMGRNQYNHRWERISTHGGKITENIVQAIARDLLRDAMTEMDNAGMRIVGHVHDEAIVEVDICDAPDTLAGMNYIMSQTPDWAPGLLLGAEGFITKRYRKG